MNVCMQRSRSITKKSNQLTNSGGGGAGGNSRKFVLNNYLNVANASVDNDNQNSNENEECNECHQSMVVNDQQIKWRSMLMTTIPDQATIECDQANNRKNQLNNFHSKAIEQDNANDNTNLEKKVKSRRVKFE